MIKTKSCKKPGNGTLKIISWRLTVRNGFLPMITEKVNVYAPQNNNLSFVVCRTFKSYMEISSRN